jgi:spore germination protein GerM
MAAAIVAAVLTLSQVKTIQVRVETKRRLEMLGKKGDTFDDVICKLIDSYVTQRGVVVTPVS